jgi:hypothetical protein
VPELIEADKLLTNGRARGFWCGSKRAALTGAGMAAPAKLMITTGEVLKVQLTSETHMLKAPSTTGAQSRIVNKMRVFLRDNGDGKEKDFTFVNSSVGVREGHRVSIVRAQVRHAKSPILLMLVNHSTGQREDSDGGFEKAMSTKGYFGQKWKAFGLSAILFVLFWLVSHFIVRQGQGGLASFFFALMFSFLMFPVFRGGVIVVDKLTVPKKERVEADRLRLEIAGRLAALEGQPVAGHQG